MTRLHAFALVALTMVAPLAAGCSADEVSSDDPSAADDGTGGSEDEVRSTLLGNVAAVRVNGGQIVAAPAKVKRILENIGLQPGAARPEEGGFRCMPSYRLEILKASGETSATAGFMCGGPGSGDRKNAKGSVQVNGKSYLIDAKDIDGIDAIAKEPLAVGDILFGVDRITIGRPGQAGKETKDGALIAKVIRGMKADQVPDPNASFPRCLPSRVVGFHKGATEIGSIGLNCGSDFRGTTKGSFSVKVPQLHGAADINAGRVIDVEAAIGSPN